MVADHPDLTEGVIDPDEAGTVTPTDPTFNPLNGDF
jgi:hypothetical protein